jgi:hypothetical protein
MKKAIFIITALVLVFSGVAAVSAYEAHLINVKAHVENALEVDTAEVDFGTVFPEEWLVKKRLVMLSESAIGELGDALGDLDSVEITLYVEWKPCPDMPFAWWDGDAWQEGVGYYNWMGYFTYLDFDENGQAPDMNLVGDPPAGDPGTAAKQVAGPFVLANDAEHFVYIGIDVPVFEGYWNSLTDVDPKPSGLSAPTYVVPADMPGFNPRGMDFGLDLKIQVTDINRVLAVAPQ